MTLTANKPQPSLIAISSSNTKGSQLTHLCPQGAGLVRQGKHPDRWVWLLILVGKMSFQHSSLLSESRTSYNKIGKHYPKKKNKKKCFCCCWIWHQKGLYSATVSSTSEWGEGRKAQMNCIHSVTSLSWSVSGDSQGTTEEEEEQVSCSLTRFRVA